MSPVGVTFLAIAMAVKATVLIRFGLLSVITILFVERLLEWPITLDSSAWYFATGLFGLLLVVAIAVMAYVTSVGGVTRLASGDAHSRSAGTT